MNDSRLSHRITAFLLVLLLLYLPSCNSTPADEESQEIVRTDEEEVQEDFVDLEDLPILSGDEIELIASNLSQDMFGNWLFSGVLQNTADYGVGMLQVQVDFLDAADAIIHSEMVYENAGGLAPGESFPFQKMLIDAPPGIDQFEWNVTHLRQLSVESASVELQGLNLTKHASGVTQITGEFLNSNDEPVVVNYIRSAVFAGGELIAVLDCEVCPSYLYSGENGSFRQLYFSSIPASIDVVDIQVHVSARPFPMLDGIRVMLDADPNTYLDTLNTYHLLGTLQNDRDDVVQITLFGTLYAADGNVLDATKANVYPSLLSPGQLGYYDMQFGGSFADQIDPANITEWSIRVDPLQSRILVEPSDLVMLEILEGGAELYDKSVRFTGQVYNQTDVEVSAIEVVISVLDSSSSDVIGVGQSDLYERLKPGEAVEFGIMIALDPKYINEAYRIYKTSSGIPIPLEE